MDFDYETPDTGVDTEPETTDAGTADFDFETMYEQGRPETSEDTAESVEEAEDATEETEPAEPEEVPDKPWKNAENAAHAQQRRQQELEQALQAERDRVVREIYGDQINPYTNQPINSYAEYTSYQKQYQAEQREAAGITEAQWQEMVNSSPEVQQARQILEQNQRFQQEQQIARGKQLIDEDVKYISSIDPSIKTLDDIRAMDNSQEIFDKVGHGYSLRDAYITSNIAQITQRKQAAARQQVINQTVSKQHLQTTGGNGSGEEISVPPEIMAEYRAMLPNATDKQIKAHYKRTMKG